MQITIHRGNQIGGCITEIWTDLARIFIDMGENLPSENNLTDEEKNEYVSTLFGKNSREKQAVFYTHAHADHIGMLANVPEGVRQYMSLGTKKHSLTKFHLLVKAGELSINKDLVLSSQKHLNILHDADVLATTEEYVSVGDIKVTAFPVPHSAHGSVMLLVEADGKRILHTGDFKREGVNVDFFEQIEKIKNVDILITEGTMLGRSQTLCSEKEVEEEMLNVMRNHRFVFVLTTSLNCDRLSSVSLAAQAANKPLTVCSSMMNCALQAFRYESPDKFGSGESFYPSQNNSKLDRWIDDKGFVMAVGAGQLDKVSDFVSKFGRKNCCLIYSVWTGYYKIPLQIKINPQYKQFRDLFLQDNIYDIHCSGHADRETIEELICNVRPADAIIGIHKEPDSSLDSLNLPVDLKEKIVFENDMREWLRSED